MDDFKNEYDDSTNVIVELNKNVEDTLYDEDKVSIEDDEMVVTKEKKKKPQKNKKKFSFKNLTKKQKIIFIVSISLIILVIAFILVYFFVIKKDKCDLRYNSFRIYLKTVRLFFLYISTTSSDNSSSLLFSC